MSKGKISFMKKTKLPPALQTTSGPSKPQFGPTLNHFDFTNTAKGAEQDVKRAPFQEILTSADQIIIPLFQRTYCWKETQLLGWWNSIMEGVTKKRCVDELDYHSVGIGRFKKSANSNGDPILICVDGQQRLTTTSLFLASIRTVALDMKKKASGDTKILDWDGLVRNVESYLFFDVDQFQHWNTNHNEKCLDKVVCFARLIPSVEDRSSYFGAIVTDEPPMDYVSCGATNQDNAKSFFDSKLKDLIKDQDSGKVLTILQDVSWSALSWMRMMKVEVASDLNLCQWFLWLQEKSLFGLASMLHNDNPGLKFNASDLIRNLLLSAFMNRQLKEQENVYQEVWLDKLQYALGGPEEMDKFVDRFLISQGYSENSDSRFVSDYEKKIAHILEFKKSSSGDAEDGTSVEDGTSRIYGGILLYARFHSYYVYTLEHQTNDENSSNFDQILLTEPAENEKVHLSILRRMVNFVSVSKVM